MTALAIFLALASPVPAYYGVSGVALSYAPVVGYWADAYLVPRPLARAVIREESGYRPDAVAYEWEYSKRLHRWFKTDRALARGLAMVATNPEHERDHVAAAGMSLEDYDWSDPSDSARVGMAYLGSLLAYFGREVRPSVAGYNCGRNRAAAWWSGARALPRETVRYLREVLK